METNIVIFDLTDDAPTAEDLTERLEAEGLQIGAFGARRIRVVTHLDVGPAAGEALLQSLKRHLA